MLTNTAYRLNKEKKLTVGFFGGSITEGAGATSWDNTSWRALITKDLRKTYPEAEIKAVNAAVGGTGSDLGLYRLEHDLLKYEPNLILLNLPQMIKSFPIRNSSAVMRAVCVRYYTAILQRKLSVFLLQQKQPKKNF